MPYEIIIKQKRKVRKMVGKTWAVIGTKETARDASFYGRNENEPRTRIEEVHGYTPEIEKEVEEEVEVLKQVVDDMDLSAVIKAINKL